MNANANAMTINVTAVNDAPTLSDTMLQTRLCRCLNFGF